MRQDEGFPLLGQLAVGAGGDAEGADRGLLPGNIHGAHQFGGVPRSGRSDHQRSAMVVQNGSGFEQDIRGGNGFGGDAELILQPIGCSDGEVVGGTATGEEDFFGLEFLKQPEEFILPLGQGVDGFSPGFGLSGDFPVSKIVFHRPHLFLVFFSSLQIYHCWVVGSTSHQTTGSEQLRVKPAAVSPHDGPTKLHGTPLGIVGDPIQQQGGIPLGDP